MTIVEDELWSLTWARRHIDADAMADALSRALDGRSLEFRSRLLVRDALRGLQEFWGEERFSNWAGERGLSDAVNRALSDDVGSAGFRSMGERLMQPTTADAVQAYFRDLGRQLRQPSRIVVGGAIALIVSNQLVRATEDIDVVDEVPPEIRTSHALVRELVERHGLILTHFQSHYLPDGWASRTWSLGRFGVLDVAVVDLYDVVVGKLFSRRPKDFDDVRTISPQLDPAKLAGRVATATDGLRSDPALLESAQRNWYVLTGHDLPSAKTA